MNQSIMRAKFLQLSFLNQQTSRSRDEIKSASISLLFMYISIVAVHFNFSVQLSG